MTVVVDDNVCQCSFVSDMGGPWLHCDSSLVLRRNGSNAPNRGGVGKERKGKERSVALLTMMA